MKFRDFFDRTYIINLPHRVDRRREITKELENIGMPLISGKVELFKAIKPKYRGEFELIGYKGAFLSHLSVLKIARAEGLKNVLIIEDDLTLRKDFKQYEGMILTELLESKWDIAHFGYCGDENHTEVNFPILQPCFEKKEIIGAHFYGVKAEIFDELINFFEVLLKRPFNHPDGGPMSPDGVLNVFPQQHPHINRLMTVQSFGNQRSSKSDISPKWFDNVPILSPTVNYGRQLGLANLKMLFKPSPKRRIKPLNQS